ncbi:hypothetical protein ACFLQX_03035 [Bacteroidota bacterium]
MENPTPPPVPTTPPPVPTKAPPVPKSKNTIDVIALIAVAYWFLSAIGIYILQRVVHNWYETPIKYVQVGSNLIFALIPIVLALTIKDKNLKLIALIVAGLVVAFLFFTNISWAISLRNIY